MDIKGLATALASRLPKLEAHDEKVRVIATFDLADFGFDEIVNPDGTVITLDDSTDNEEVP